MATVPVDAVKEVKMADLDDDLMQKWLSKLSIKEQTAVTRVCKRIEANAYKLTTMMIATDLPDDVCVKIIHKLPKLENICFIIPMGSWNERLDMRLRTYLKYLAAQKPDIRCMFGLPSKYKTYFVEMAKLQHENYDGSTFSTLINEENYERSIKKFPGIKLRCRILGFDSEEHTTSKRSRKKRLSDPNLVALNVMTTIPNYNFDDILTMTKNLTYFWFHQSSTSKKPNYAHIFDSVVQLPMKKFKLEVFPYYQDQKFGWKNVDFDSFKNLLELNSLVDVTLRFPQSNKTYLKTLECFLNCSRNNFHHFSSQGPDPDLSVSHFLGVDLNDRSQLYPTMHLGLRGHGNNVTFPIAQFIRKFSPKYREFEFKDKKTMVKMVNACTDLIKNQPRVHFVFYAVKSKKWTISFRPYQLEEGEIKFSMQINPTYYLENNPFMQSPYV